ncbi:hypothetical protein ACQZV8_09760 [Magnetococcales bacterium HHB-1]
MSACSMALNNGPLDISILLLLAFAGGQMLWSRWRLQKLPAQA